MIVMKQYEITYQSWNNPLLSYRFNIFVDTPEQAAQKAPDYLMYMLAESARRFETPVIKEVGYEHEHETETASV